MFPAGRKVVSFNPITQKWRARVRTLLWQVGCLHSLSRSNCCRLHIMCIQLCSAHGQVCTLQNVVDTSGGCGASFSLEVVSPEFEGTCHPFRSMMCLSAVLVPAKMLRPLSNMHHFNCCTMSDDRHVVC